MAPAPHDQTALWKLQTVSALCADPVALAEACAGGHLHFRAVVKRAFDEPVKSGLCRAIDNGEIDAMFAHLCERFILVWQTQLKHQATPKRALDAVEIIAPPTQQEIDAAWELTDESTDEARRVIYGSEHPIEHFDKLKRGARPEDLVVRE